MVAGAGDGLLPRWVIVSSGQSADVAPGFPFVEPIEAVAGGYAGLAPGAFVELDLEGVLLAGAGSGERNEMPVEGLTIGESAVIMVLRKRCGWSFEVLLLRKESIDEVDIRKGIRSKWA